MTVREPETSTRSIQNSAVRVDDPLIDLQQDPRPRWHPRCDLLNARSACISFVDACWSLDDEDLHRHRNDGAKHPSTGLRGIAGEVYSPLSLRDQLTQLTPNVGQIGTSDQHCHHRVATPLAFIDKGGSHSTILPLGRPAGQTAVPPAVLWPRDHAAANFR